MPQCLCAHFFAKPPVLLLHCSLSNFTTFNTLDHLPCPDLTPVELETPPASTVSGVCLRVSAQNHQKSTHGVDLNPLHWATSWTKPPFFFELDLSSSFLLAPIPSSRGPTDHKVRHIDGQDTGPTSTK